MKSKMSKLIMILLLFVTPIIIKADNPGSDGTEITFGSNNEDTKDLFKAFKNVMPGGTYTQSIRIFNQGDKSLKVYLRWEDLVSIDDNLLEKIHIELSHRENIILSDRLIKQENLKADHELFKLDPFDYKDLNVTLSLDPDIGNVYQEALSELHWEFYAVNMDALDYRVPGTGISSNSLTYFLLLILGILVLQSIYEENKKFKNK